MVANLSAHKRGWDDRWEEYSNWAEKGEAYKNRLLDLVDEDTNAFNKIMDAFRLPKDNEADVKARKQAIQDATKYAIEIPYQVMETAYNSMEVMKRMAEIGLKSSVSDAGVGALCARTAVFGAFLNVKINTSGVDDAAYVQAMLAKGQEIQDKTVALEAEILKLVEGKV